MPFYDWTARIPFGESEAAAASTEELTVIQIPVDSSPNQELTTTLEIDGSSLNVRFNFRYNEMAGYWVMTLTDPATGSVLLDSIPLITGDDPYLNLLAPYAYLKIGSAFLWKVGNADMDYPDDTNLGTDFILIWSDTPA